MDFAEHPASLPPQHYDVPRHHHASSAGGLSVYLRTTSQFIVVVYLLHSCEDLVKVMELTKMKGELLL